VPKPAGSRHPKESAVPDLTPEQKERLKDVPKGTWALTMTVAITMFLAWVALYVGKFLAQGPVS
jgi:cell division protein FtsX